MGTPEEIIHPQSNSAQYSGIDGKIWWRLLGLV
jgi:hypothetical protein